jgi:hypothetical protein
LKLEKHQRREIVVAKRNSSSGDAIRVNNASSTSASTAVGSVVGSEARQVDVPAVVIANFVAGLADLDGPKRALRILEDSVRLEAYDCGIRSALREQPGKCSLFGIYASCR